MQRLFFLTFCLFLAAFAVAAADITVLEVETFAEAANAQEARMKALQNAEKAAFSKLLEQWQLPAATEVPADAISAMVTGYDVISEHMGVTSYRAKLNLHFDAAQANALQARLRVPPTAPNVAVAAPVTPAPVMALPQGSQVPVVAPPVVSAMQPLPGASMGQVKIITALGHVSDWVRVRRMMEQIGQVRDIQLVAVSASQADMLVHYEGALATLIDRLQQMGMQMTPYEGYWVMAGSR